MLVKPRYEARSRELNPADRRWGVFDTFVQDWVEGEWWRTKGKAVDRAEVINHAYERATSP